MTEDSKESKKPVVIGEFESSNIYNVVNVSPNHFTCEMKREQPSVFKYPDHHGYWFYLRVENANGKKVTIDITNCDWMPSHWKHYKPVVSYSNPNNLNSKNWEKITDTSRSGKTFRFIHTYQDDAAWVALRYPYTYSYHQKYLASIEGNRFIKRETILITNEGRNLDAVTITDDTAPLSKKKTIVVYAREHGIEQEGSWVCQGVIEFLISDAPEAENLRKTSVFLIIPLSMPDAVYHGRCTDPGSGSLIACDFSPRNFNNMKTPEARAIWKKVTDIAQNGQIGICISLHSPHGWEENIWANLHDSIKRDAGKKLNKAIFAHCNGFTKREPEYRWGKFSLPGRCAKEFGSIALLLEINQHAKRSFLSIGDLHKIGEAICKGTYDYYRFNNGQRYFNLKRNISLSWFLKSCYC